MVFFGLLAAAGNILGGFLIARAPATSHKGMIRLVAIGAGFMLSAVVLEALPRILEGNEENWSSSLLWMLAGYLLIQIAEHAIAPHFHFGEEVHVDEVLRKGVATTAIIALTIHAIFDGVAIASGILSSLRLGVFLSLAVLIHKIPEGFTVASIVMSSGKGINAARRATIVIALATFAGILLVALFRPLLEYTLPLSAGVTLYVAASDLIPEVNREGGPQASLLVLVGVGALLFSSPDSSRSNVVAIPPIFAIIRATFSFAFFRNPFP